MINISGKNIALRNMTQKENRALWRKFIPTSGQFVYDEETADARFEREQAQSERNKTAGIFTKTDEIIGAVSFDNIVFSEKRCDLNVFLANSTYFGKGYGTEAVSLAVKYAHNELGLEKIYAEIDSENIAMKRVLEKNGFSHTKTFKNGKILVYFALLR